MQTFTGFRRTQGLPGLRNVIAVIPSVFCANTVARRIAEHVSGALAFCHPVGCSQVGLDLELTARGLKGLAANPNIYGVVVVGLGCERFRPQELAESVVVAGKPVEMVMIQEDGDTLKTTAKGIHLAGRMAQAAAVQTRETFPLADLCLGLKCGGTDATSGLAANPALGWVTDAIVAEGGRAIFTEVTELIGAERILASRGKSPEVAAAIGKTIAAMERRLSAATASKGVRHRSALISPGNEDGGVTTVAEKALGGITKAGTGPISGVLDYGEYPREAGLYLLDCVGHDGEAVTGLVASGCQAVVFTTGRGTPTGFPGVPVLKITGNDTTWERMGFNLDFNAGAILTGTPIPQVGERLLEKVLAIASGEPARAELLGHDELFCITRI